MEINNLIHLTSNKFANIIERNKIPSYYIELAARSIEGILRAEKDFVRAESASFNPAPMRISQIIIDNFNIKDEDTISAAILFHSYNQETKELDQNTMNKIETTELINSNAYKILLEAIQYSHEFKCNSKEAIIIFIASLIDRLRHSHLSNKTNLKDELYKIIFSIKDDITESDAAFNTEIKNLINNWLRRNGFDFLI